MRCSTSGPKRNRRRTCGAVAAANGYRRRRSIRWPRCTPTSISPRAILCSAAQRDRARRPGSGARHPVQVERDGLGFRKAGSAGSASTIRRFSQSTSGAALCSGPGGLRDTSDAGPLAGVRVLDFSWVWAGPYCGLQFAHMGAEVIRVESARRPCLNRCIHPYADGKPGSIAPRTTINGTRASAASQLDIATHRRRHDIAYELVRHCDVVIENFSPGAMDRLGLRLSGFERGQHRPSDDGVAVRLWPDRTVIAIRHYGPLIGGPIGAVRGQRLSRRQNPRSPDHLWRPDPSGMFARLSIDTATDSSKRTGQGQYYRRRRCTK